MAGEAVLKYLIDTNRPYSCADVTVNMRGAFTKSAVQKALDTLSETGQIRCKLYGKQKVYAALQTDNVEENNDDVDYDHLINTLNTSLASLKEELKSAESKLKTLTSTPTDKGAQIQIDQITANVQTLEAKLDTLRNSTQVVSAADKQTITTGRQTYLKEYRKRKRICTDMIEAVMEVYPKSKKSFLEEYCVETDEMANFKITNT